MNQALLLLDMVIRTNSSVQTSIFEGKSIEKEQAINLIKEKKFTTLIQQYGLIDGAGPQKNQESTLNDLLLQEYNDYSHRFNYNPSPYFPKEDKYKNGLNIFADLLNSVALTMVRKANFTENNYASASSSNYVVNEYEFENDYYEQSNNDEVDVEALAWEHHLEYIENHDD